MADKEKYTVLVDGTTFNDSDAYGWRPGDIVQRSSDRMFKKPGDTRVAALLSTSEIRNYLKVLVEVEDQTGNQIISFQSVQLTNVVKDVNKHLDAYKLMQPIFTDNGVFYAIMELKGAETYEENA